MTARAPRKSWMVDMPSTTATPKRAGKPIASPRPENERAARGTTRAATDTAASGARVRDDDGPHASRSATAGARPASASVLERERAEQARRERTRAHDVAQSAETSARMRARMVERLAQSGIRHDGVLAGMKRVPRHRFVDDGLASRAYDDTPLPIGHAQTISQPYVVARMTELLLQDLPVPPARARVLEIGTGCGYQAAVLAQVVGEVYSIERIRALHDRARDNLRALRVPNLRLVYGDGLQGLPDAAPFDAMLIAAAGDALPDALLDQLAVGGRAIAPLAAGRGRGDNQTLCLFVRSGRHQWSTTWLDAVRFVPLKPGLA